MEENPVLLILFIIVAFPIFFGLLWTFVMLINSFMTGWQNLARHYHHPYPFAGKIHRMQSIFTRWGRYSAVMNIGVSESGLYLVPMMIFRPFHKPLLIPWDEIEAEEAHYFLFPSVRLTFRAAPNSKFSLYRKTKEILEPYLTIQPKV